MVRPLTHDNQLASSRPYDAFYRRPGQMMHSMLHDQLIQDPYTGQYGTKRDTPDLDTKPNITHRKRVPVAVSSHLISMLVVDD